MKHTINTLLFFSLCLSIGCSDENMSNALLEECERIKDGSILPEGETPCFYQSVYLYKGELYTLANCCVCDLVAIPIDCDESPLCEVEMENCIDDFFQNAEFQFNIE